MATPVQLLKTTISKLQSSISDLEDRLDVADKTDFSDDDVVITKVVTTTYTFTKDCLSTTFGASDDDNVVLKLYTDGSYKLSASLTTAADIEPNTEIEILASNYIATTSTYTILKSLGYVVKLSSNGLTLQYNNAVTGTVAAGREITFTCSFEIGSSDTLTVSTEVQTTEEDDTTIPDQEDVETTVYEFDSSCVNSEWNMDYCKVRTNSYDSTYYEVLGKFTLINGEVPALNIEQLLKKNCFRTSQSTSIYTIYNGNDFMIILTNVGLFAMTKSAITTGESIEFSGSFYVNDGDTITINTTASDDANNFTSANVATVNFMRRSIAASRLTSTSSVNGKTYHLEGIGNNAADLYFTRLADNLYNISGKVTIDSEGTAPLWNPKNPLFVCNLVSELHSTSIAGYGYAHCASAEAYNQLVLFNLSWDSNIITSELLFRVILTSPDK